MRYSTLSGFAVLAASLLVKDVIAGPISLKNGQLMKREGVKVVVTHEVVVSFKDGKWTTGTAKAVKTITEGVKVPAPSPQPIVNANVAPPVEEKPKPAAAPPAYVPPPPPAPKVEAPKADPPKADPPKVDPPKVEAPKVETPTPEIQTSGNKEGIAYDEGKFVPGPLGGGKPSWAWNWAASTGKLPQGCEFIPTLMKDKTGEWKEKASAAIAKGTKHLFSFNEPDHPNQQNLDPGTAAKLYAENMNQFSGQAKLGAPGVTNGQESSGMGLGWLKNFLNQCSSCKIDFINVHFYWDDKSASADFVMARLKEHIEAMKKLAGGKPIWVTEIKFLGSEKAKFDAAASKYMSENVERFSFFPYDY